MSAYTKGELFEIVEKKAVKLAKIAKLLGVSVSAVSFYKNYPDNKVLSENLNAGIEKLKALPNASKEELEAYARRTGAGKAAAAKRMGSKIERKSRSFAPTPVTVKKTRKYTRSKKTEETSDDIFERVTRLIQDASQERDALVLRVSYLDSLLSTVANASRIERANNENFRVEQKTDRLNGSAAHAN